MYMKTSYYFGREKFNFNFKHDDLVFIYHWSSSRHHSHLYDIRERTSRVDFRR